MSLIPWKPFRDFDQFFEDWEEPERFLSAVPNVRTPKIDIYEEGKNIIAEAELPGLDPKDIKLEVEDNLLKIEGKSEKKKEEKKKGYYRKEISESYYKRVVPLPVEVKGEKAEAEYKDGLLRVVIPKIEPKKEEKKKGIKIKVRSSK